MFDLIMFGVVVGVLAVVTPALVVLRCRFGFHRWRPWCLTANGGAQFRTCTKCGLWDVKPFVGFTITQPAEAKGEQS